MEIYWRCIGDVLELYYREIGIEYDVKGRIVLHCTKKMRKDCVVFGKVVYLHSVIRYIQRLDKFEDEENTVDIGYHCDGFCDCTDWRQLLYA